MRCKQESSAKSRRGGMAEANARGGGEPEILAARVAIPSDSPEIRVEVLGVYFGRSGAIRRDGRIFQDTGLRRGARVWHDGDGVPGDVESPVPRDKRLDRQDFAGARISARRGRRDVRARGSRVRGILG